MDGPAACHETRNTKHETRLATYNPKMVLAFWESIGLRGGLAEYQFRMERKWRFDFAFPKARVAVEVQGAIFGTGHKCPTCRQTKAGGHTMGAALQKEHEKLNTAAGAGWRVLFCQTKEIRTVQFAQRVKAALAFAAE